jgi:prepilin-type N-terminal cleavage/methylation domain-containing protein
MVQKIRDITSPIRQGFTFVELIIVVAIILVISAGVIVNYNSYTDSERVRQAGLTIKSDLRLVVSKVNSGVKPLKPEICTALERYDVTFTKSCNSDGLSCYTIVTKCSDSADTQTVYLPKEVHFDSDYQTVQFLPLAAGTNLSEDMVITLNGPTSEYHIKISSSAGAISNY